MEVVADGAGASWTAWYRGCGGLIIALLIVIPVVASAQARIEPQDAIGVQPEFNKSSGASRLQCEFKPVRPALDFTFRFHTGYRIELPLSQFLGARHTGNIVLRVTPDRGVPEQLSYSFALPDAPENAEAEISGDFVVGEGSYRVDAVVEDNLQHRVCWSQWRIRAKRSAAEREISLAIPPLTVGAAPSAHIAQQTGRPDLGRLTILMHAAPLLPEAAKVRASDVSMLVGSLSTLLEQLPARSVTLVVFNLEQQKVLFRQVGFTAAGVARVGNAINELQLGLVSYSALQQPDGGIGLLRNLVQEEVSKPTARDALVFLGPHTRLHDPIPVDMVRGFESGPRVFYMEYLPQLSLLSRDYDPAHGVTNDSLTCNPYSPEVLCLDPDEPDMLSPDGWRDSIERLVSRLKGEVLVVRQPADLARAIKQIATRLTREGPKRQLSDRIAGDPVSAPVTSK
jgi:hypothetical protein